MSSTAVLQTLWLNDLASPSDVMSFPFMSALKVTPTVDGAVRKYASGRRRGVSLEGVDHPQAVTLKSCSRAQVAWLEAHVGRVLCARDDRGRRMWVMYWQSPTDEHQYNPDADIDLALDEVTITEAV